MSLFMSSSFLSDLSLDHSSRFCQVYGGFANRGVFTRLPGTYRRSYQSETQGNSRAGLRLLTLHYNNTFVSGRAGRSFNANLPTGRSQVVYSSYGNVEGQNAAMSLPFRHARTELSHTRPLSQQDARSSVVVMAKATSDRSSATPEVLQPWRSIASTRGPGPPSELVSGQDPRLEASRGEPCFVRGMPQEAMGDERFQRDGAAVTSTDDLVQAQRRIDELTAMLRQSNALCLDDAMKGSGARAYMKHFPPSGCR